jgi:hypothetical protein
MELRIYLFKLFRFKKLSMMENGPLICVTDKENRNSTIKIIISIMQLAKGK